MSVAVEYIATTTEAFRNIKKLGDKTFAQLGEEDFHWSPSEHVNSIAINIQHLAGNMRSRFTDFLTTDGEKPDRNRDGEFEEKRMSREELISAWETGWTIFFDALEDIGPDDLERIVTIRTEPHSVMKALQRQISHYAYHVGQIVHIARERKGADWQTLSIPKGKSAEYLAVPFRAK